VAGEFKLDHGPIASVAAGALNAAGGEDASVGEEKPTRQTAAMRPWAQAAATWPLAKLLGSAVGRSTPPAAQQPLGLVRKRHGYVRGPTVW
jgi:hypothetical protein